MLVKEKHIIKLIQQYSGRKRKAYKLVSKTIDSTDIHAWLEKRQTCKFVTKNSPYKETSESRKYKGIIMHKTEKKIKVKT